MNDRRIGRGACPREVRRRARAARRRARADGRQRRQCARRARRRPQDRGQADPANMATSKPCSPPRRAMKPKLRDNLIEHADMARLSRELVRWSATPRCPSRSRIWSSRASRDEPLRAFLEHHGFKSLLRASCAGQVADAIRSPRGRDAESGMPDVRAEPPMRPRRLRDGHRRGRARPLDRRGARQRLRRGRYRDRPASTAIARRIWSGSASRPRRTAPATSRSGTWRRRPVRRRRRRSCRSRRGAGEAEAAARGPGGAQDRA